MSRRAYDLVRSLAEHHGGTIAYEREGYRHGAWVITVGDKRVTVEASGERSFPPLDALYVPRHTVVDPEHWDDYQNVLVPDAEARLLALLEPLDGSGLSCEDTQELHGIIERTTWKFAWTYARTYPHEYTTKAPKARCSADDHAKLIDCIERYGVLERFGDARRKYFYFQERKYWHMGVPSSENPEERPNVINRTWVDVRRHAENVRHRWTAEEVELQQRLWEIRLERATDRGGSQGTS